ncbi:hypothetical protein ACL7DI_11805 [Bordetella pertussis]|uniref:hypothetical protein n=1 Tax=Bordetella pertussis TaxID=520 RepID=UPI00138AF0C7
MHRLRAGARYIVQVAQVAAQLLRVVARQQGRPGRQAAGVLGAQLVGQLGAALLQHRLLRHHLLFQAGEFGFGLAAGLAQFTQPEIDARNG